MPQPVASGKRKRRATNGATHERRGKRRATGDSVRIDDADESAVT